MIEKELQEIEARHKSAGVVVEESTGIFTLASKEYTARVMLDDVPALIAEVRRLRERLIKREKIIEEYRQNGNYYNYCVNKKDWCEAADRFCSDCLDWEYVGKYFKDKEATDDN